MARLLLTAFRWFDDSLRQSLEAQGLPVLTHAQSLVMSRVTSDGVRISELARHLEMTRQGAQKSVAGLEEAGLLSTQIDPLNSSAKLVQLTAKGRKSIAVAQDIFDALEAELALRIGTEKTKTLREALEQDWGDPPAIN